MNVLALDLHSGDVTSAQQWATHFVQNANYYACKVFEARHKGGGERYGLNYGAGETVFSRDQLKLIAVLLARDGWQLVSPPGYAGLTFVRL